MKDIQKFARQVASDPPFQALSHAALKSRASRLRPGEIIQVGGYEILLDEDDRLGVVVQLLLSQEKLKDLALTKARETGQSLPEEGPRLTSWMDEFMLYLEKILKEEHDVTVSPGPGGELVFERAAYRERTRFSSSGPL